MAVITLSDTKELTATDGRSCFNFGSDTRGRGRKWGDRMANGDKRISIEEAWDGGKSIPFTRDYEYHTLFSQKTIPQGTKAIIAHPHRGFLGKITHVDVRLADGERVRSVPIDYLVV
jgi:hypothetical protein